MEWEMGKTGIWCVAENRTKDSKAEEGSSGVTEASSRDEMMQVGGARAANTAAWDISCKLTVDRIHRQRCFRLPRTFGECGRT